MMGPVYALELVQASRRARKYPWRWIYAGALLIEAQWLTVGVLQSLFGRIGPFELFSTQDTHRVAVIAESLFRLIVAEQTLAILLVAPAFAAGSITDERRKGTLEFLLISPLSAAEIILGKWLGQATQVVHLLSPGYFLLALLAGTIGAPMPPLLLSIAEQIALLYSVTALSLIASTWSRSTAKSIVGVYFFFGIVLFAEWMFDLPLIGPSLWAFPLQIDVSVKQHLVGMGTLVGLTFISLALAVWRLRPAHERQRNAATRVLGRWWDRPPLGDAPMRWKERFTSDWFSIPLWRTLPRSLKCLIIAGLVAGLALAMPDSETFVILGVLQFFLSGLFVAVRSAGAITAERENQTWESLLTTHMDAYQIVRGKLWGQIDALRPYLLAYLFSALLGSLFTSWLAALWILYTWLASWVFLYGPGAVGISRSVKTASTWRSILITLTAGNVSIFLTAAMFAILGVTLGYIFFGVTGPNAAQALFLLALGSLPGLALIFGGTEQELQQAEQELKRRISVVRPARTDSK
jgi:ABC-type transport system involved in multi-copper enzyme maturation permease subunit